jgi:O-antigen ligase
VLFRSFSRVGIITCAFVCLAMLLTKFRPSKKMLLTVGACLTGLLVIVAKMPDTGNAQVDRMLLTVKAPLASAALGSRLPLWEVALDGYKKSPIIGHGLHSYKYQHADYLKNHWDDLIAKYEVVEKNMHSAHNLILGIMSDLGTLGLGLFILTVAIAVHAAWKLAPPFQITLWAMLYAHLIGITEFMLYEPWMIAILFSSFGFIFAGNTLQADGKIGC